MNTGIFASPTRTEILVVVGYEDWTDELIARGYCPRADLVRPATTSEIIAAAQSNAFPAWCYTSILELIKDEHTEGASQAHLEQLMNWNWAHSDQSMPPHCAHQ